MNKPISPPARLKFSFASYAFKAVIVRRGPSKWVRLISWDTAKDEFTLGQWMHAKLRSFALSPSGRYLLTIVLNHSKEPHHWITLSRPPYFTALAMWHSPGLEDLGYCEFPEEGVILVDATYYQPELLKGFELKDHVVMSRNEVIEKYGRPAMGRQPLHPDNGNESLKKEGMRYLYGSGPRLQYEWDKIILHHNGKEAELSEDLIDPQVDQRGRLIYTKEGDGTLYAATIRDDLSLDVKPLVNFDDQQFESIEAPDWAQKYVSDAAAKKNKRGK